MHRLILLALSIAVSVSARAETFAPEFFAFENGARFSSRGERIATLKSLGFDGIGSASPRDLEARLPLYDRAGLKIFSLYVGTNLASETPHYDPIVTEAIRQLKGRDTVIELFVQGGDGASDDRAVALVRELADQAESSGLRVVLYPHTGFYIDSIGDAVRIAKQANRKNVGVMFNLCHFLNVERDGDIEQALREAGPLLWRVSINGADVDGRGWGKLIQPLDRGTFDQVSLLKILRRLEYDGAIGLQCFGVKDSSQDHLRRSIEAWKKSLRLANRPQSGPNDPTAEQGKER